MHISTYCWIWYGEIGMPITNTKYSKYFRKQQQNPILLLVSIQIYEAKEHLVLIQKHNKTDLSHPSKFTIITIDLSYLSLISQSKHSPFTDISLQTVSMCSPSQGMGDGFTYPKSPISLYIAISPLCTCWNLYSDRYVWTCLGDGNIHAFI